MYTLKYLMQSCEHVLHSAVSEIRSNRFLYGHHDGVYTQYNIYNYDFAGMRFLYKNTRIAHIVIYVCARVYILYYVYIRRAYE